MRKKKVLKILIPVLIVFVIAGLWGVKHLRDTSAQDALLNEDFALEAETIDIEALKEHELPIVIDFGADWCVPCMMFEPTLKAINEEMQGKAIIKYVDVDESVETTSDFPVQVVPTQVFIMADGTPYVPGEDVAAEFIQYTDKTTGEHTFTVHQGGLSEEEFRDILADMGVNG